jgi:hypothetical protein
MHRTADSHAELLTRIALFLRLIKQAELARQA